MATSFHHWYYSFHLPKTIFLYLTNQLIQVNQRSSPPTPDGGQLWLKLHKNKLLFVLRALRHNLIYKERREKNMPFIRT